MSDWLEGYEENVITAKVFFLTRCIFTDSKFVLYSLLHFSGNIRGFFQKNNDQFKEKKKTKIWELGHERFYSSNIRIWENSLLSLLADNEKINWGGKKVKLVFWYYDDRTVDLLNIWFFKICLSALKKVESGLLGTCYAFHKKTELFNKTSLYIRWHCSY